MVCVDVTQGKDQILSWVTELLDEYKCEVAEDGIYTRITFKVGQSSRHCHHHNHHLPQHLLLLLYHLHHQLHHHNWFPPTVKLRHPHSLTPHDQPPQLCTNYCYPLYYSGRRWRSPWQLVLLMLSLYFASWRKVIPLELQIPDHHIAAKTLSSREKKEKKRK